MLFKKMLRTIAQYKAQFISMIVMIALGVGVFVGFNIEWNSLEKNTDAFFKDTNFADYRIVDEKGLTAEDVDKLSQTDYVKAAGLYFSAVLPQGDNKLSYTVTTNPDVSLFVLISGAEYDPTDKDGVWLDASYAKLNNIAVGDKLSLKLGIAEAELTVRGLVKSGEYMICVIDETQIMPDHKTFGYAYVTPEFYKSVPFIGGKYYQINVSSDLDKTAFCDKVNELFGKTMLVLGKEETASYAGVQSEKDEGVTMSTILPVLFLLIGVLTMITTMHRITAKEKTQIGTLKALGFKDSVITRHYTSYAFAIGLVGIALGVGIGFAIAAIILNPSGMMGTYIDIPSWTLYVPYFCWIVLAALLALLTLVGFLSVKQMLVGTAADALRPYTPKKMRKLLVERGKLWDKLGFGAQWNIRDIFRHKARTAMSLLGIIGCMVLLVGSFGMQDSVNYLVDNSYIAAMNYQTHVFFTEDSTEEQRNAYADKIGDVDKSASLSVELGNKAVALDVYSVTNDHLRFFDKDGNRIELQNDGAYVCRRIADANNLKVGDTFVVKPYGKDKEYKLTVKGIVSSVTESVIVTADYADNVGVEYMFDSVYTAKTADQLPDDPTVVKAKQKVNEVIDSFNSMMELMTVSVTVLVIAALVLGVVVLYNLGVMSYTERYREMATLKVVGFKDSAIGKLLTAQNLWVTLFGMIVGLPLGILTLRVLINALASEYEMQAVAGPVTYIVSILLTFGMSLLVSLLVARKNKQIDMVEALKMNE